MLRRVAGNSMHPALRKGNVVLATRWWRTLRAGDVVIFEHKGLEKIKRISMIKAEKLRVTGDNAVQSTDSRTFGFIPRSSVVAKVVWPRA
ncbi:MAG: S26 family signal peptidase [Candidatus Saccharibacteria bacterium]|nr:S26 family signal peptidase [Candidatus Saccharibacteria bacterium]